MGAVERFSQKMARARPHNRYFSESLWPSAGFGKKIVSMGPPVPEKKILVVFTTYTLQVTSTWMHCIAVTFKVKLILDAGLCPARGTASNNIKISRRTFESSDLANYTINQGKPMLFWIVMTQRRFRKQVLVKRFTGSRKKKLGDLCYKSRFEGTA